MDRVCEERNPDQLQYMLDEIEKTIARSKEQEARLVRRVNDLIADRHYWDARRNRLVERLLALGDYGQTME